MKFPLLFVVAALTLVGCGKNSETTAPMGAVPGVDIPSTSPPPRYVTAVAENRPVAGAAGEVNGFLTEQLKIFVQQKRRLPADFAELARERLDSVPRPPEGKKWVIDTATQTVKAVAAQ